jgi:hypothetical protein
MLKIRGFFQPSGEPEADRVAVEGNASSRMNPLFGPEYLMLVRGWAPL